MNIINISANDFCKVIVRNYTDINEPKTCNVKIISKI